MRGIIRGPTYEQAFHTPYQAAGGAKYGERCRLKLAFKYVTWRNSLLISVLLKQLTIQLSLSLSPSLSLSILYTTFNTDTAPLLPEINDGQLDGRAHIA